MLRQQSGSVVCPSCGLLVGVNDDKCLNCGRWNPGMWGYAPVLNRLGRDLGFVPFVTGACILLYAATVLTNTQGMGGGIFNLLSPSTSSLFLFGASGGIPVFTYGRWWTVLTAGWLHGGLIHIFFNLMSFRNLAPPVAEFYGASRMVIIYVFSGVAGFTASTLGGTYLGFIPLLGRGGFTVGASASISGLLGALWFYGHRSGSSMVLEQAKSWAFGLIIIGFLIPNIDNWAHLGGLVGGYYCSKFLDPLYPERLDHMLIALASLVITAVAIGFSVIHGLPFI